MAVINKIKDRRTSVDAIFDYLYAEISSLRLRPGDKISEAEIASQFGVSRQPVRDAFSRLENMDLLLIRPQRATEVKRFSAREITKSRFVRSSVESEVLRRATANCSAEDAEVLTACLEAQAKVIEQNDYAAFSRLDYEFHKTMCEIAKVDFAFEVISAEKAKVDRLCNLSLAQEDRMPQLLGDHQNIAKAVISGDSEAAVDFGMLHLSRLDSTIATISSMNADYFEAE
ncbi:GntR family transcriptional regulator [Gymnodinialimonas sp. 2305UL16-5]|uniref:GntR family transcriptional regulator n=1 Tax=Gymnodinialimonas mytili TaxID=3126503 RepID=UPI0030AD082D